MLAVIIACLLVLVAVVCWYLTHNGTATDEGQRRGIDGQVCESHGINVIPKEFHKFIRSRVIPNFEAQRIEGDQFAALILVGEGNLEETRFEPSNDEGIPLVDSDRLTSPPRSQYCNYVAACPHLEKRHIHAEKALLGELEILWNAYLQRNPRPRCIILYSWMQPCTTCTNAIIRKLKSIPYISATLIVAYTIEWKGIRPTENEQNRQRLRSEGITVEQVKYSGLPQRYPAPAPAPAPAPESCVIL